MFGPKLAGSGIFLVGSGTILVEGDKVHLLCYIFWSPLCNYLDRSAIPNMYYFSYVIFLNLWKSELEKMWGRGKVIRGNNYKEKYREMRGIAIKNLAKKGKNRDFQHIAFKNKLRAAYWLLFFCFGHFLQLCWNLLNFSSHIFEDITMFYFLLAWNYFCHWVLCIANKIPEIVLYQNIFSMRKYSNMFLYYLVENYARFIIINHNILYFS